MTDRNITIGVSMSRKISDNAYGSYEFSSWESREIPADSDQTVVDALRGHLTRSVENDLKMKIERVRKDGLVLRKDLSTGTPTP